VQLKKISAGVLALILWIVTAVVGLVEIVVVRTMVLRLYGRLGSSYWSGVTLGNFTVLFLAIVWLVFVIGTGEYHRGHVGERSSWRLFGMTVGVELAVFVLAQYI
jgi:hypothetical protein